MKEKDKVLQALCDGLGENYKLMEIDLELCIYRDFGNRFEVEVSGVHTAKQNKKATIYLWCMDATINNVFILLIPPVPTFLRICHWQFSTDYPLSQKGHL